MCLVLSKKANQQMEVSIIKIITTIVMKTDNQPISIHTLNLNQNPVINLPPSNHATFVKGPRLEQKSEDAIDGPLSFSRKVQFGRRKKGSEVSLMNMNSSESLSSDAADIIQQIRKTADEAKDQAAKALAEAATANKKAERLEQKLNSANMKIHALATILKEWLRNPTTVPKEHLELLEISTVGDILAKYLTRDVLEKSCVVDELDKSGL